MGNAQMTLVVALRETAARLARQDVQYKWSSFAHCNCGHLAQTITGLAPTELQRLAMKGEGDWASQARPLQFPEFDYGDRPALDEGAWEPFDVGACQATGAPLDEVLAEMYSLGLSPEDVQHLERLTSPAVRRRLGNHRVDFPHHIRENLVAYLNAWADLIEEAMPTETAAAVYLEAAE